MWLRNVYLSIHLEGARSNNQSETPTFVAGSQIRGQVKVETFEDPVRWGELWIHVRGSKGL